MLPQAHTVILVSFTLLLCVASVSAQLLPIVIVTKTLIGARPTNDVVPSSWPTMGTGIPFVPTPLPTCSISNPVCPQDIAVCPPECPDKCFLNTTSSCCPNVGTPYCPDFIPTSTTCAAPQSQCSGPCNVATCTTLATNTGSVITALSSSALTSSGAPSLGSGVSSTLAPTSSSAATSFGQKMRTVGLGNWVVAGMVATRLVIDF